MEVHKSKVIPQPSKFFMPTILFTFINHAEWWIESTTRKNKYLHNTFNYLRIIKTNK